ncbi:MAG: hypothetical protein HYX48_06475 [Chlamydiales bacterium]|nr:hypothetical protein [Chlamydiales bacterium]
MLKVFRKFSLFSLLIGSSALSAGEPTEIDPAWLAKIGDRAEYIDYTHHFQRLFKKLKVRTFLEFGVGFATKSFLDSCNKVISVEFITNGYGPEGMKNFLEHYKGYSNWIPLAFFTGYIGDTSWAPYKHQGSESVYKANSYQAATHKNYAPIDDFYLVELNAFILNLMRSNHIDAAFVDSGSYIRGDLVQLLLGKVPVVLACNTHCRLTGEKDDIYGYGRIQTPDNYEEIYIPKGAGTTAWVSRSPEYKEIAQDLKKYALECTRNRK